MLLRSLDPSFARPLRDVATGLLFALGALGIRAVAQVSERFLPASVWFEATIEVLEFGGLILAGLAVATACFYGLAYALRALRFLITEVRKTIREAFS